MQWGAGSFSQIDLHPSKRDNQDEAALALPDPIAVTPAGSFFRLPRLGCPGFLQGQPFQDLDDLPVPIPPLVGRRLFAVSQV